MVKEPSERRLRRGRPFVTRELIEKRTSQREELRLVADFDIRRAVEGKDPPLDEVLPASDRAMIESELRDYADSLRSGGDLSGVLQRRALVTQAEVLGRWANGVRAASGAPVAQVRGEFANRWKTAADQVSTQRADDETLLKYVATLILADEAADDGYRDPRLTE
jgi:hypothetical protein